MNQGSDLVGKRTLVVSLGAALLISALLTWKYVSIFEIPHNYAVIGELYFTFAGTAFMLFVIALIFYSRFFIRNNSGK